MSHDLLLLDLGLGPSSAPLVVDHVGGLSPAPIGIAALPGFLACLQSQKT